MKRIDLVKCAFAALIGFGLVAGGYRAGMDHPQLMALQPTITECGSVVVGVQATPDGKQQLLIGLTLTPDDQL